MLLNLYLKAYRLLYLNEITMSRISMNLGHNVSNLSRLEKGENTSESFYLKVLNYYKISTIVDDNGRVLINTHKNSLSYIDDYEKAVSEIIKNKVKKIVDDVFEAKKKYQEIEIDKYSLLLPFDLLHRHILKLMHSFSLEDVCNEENHSNLLHKISDLFPENARYVWLFMHSREYLLEGKYKEARKYILEACDLGHFNVKSEIVCKYYLLSVSYFICDFETIFFTKKELDMLLVKQPNNYRKIQILNDMSLVYSLLNNLNEAERVLLEAIHLSKDNGYRLYTILSYNLARILRKQKKYKEAIGYYLSAFKDMPDNTTCFELAWCYYKIDDRINAWEYINKSKQKDMPIYKEYSFLYCDWLEAMLNKSYSKKCEKILLKLQNKYLVSMQPESKRFLYQLLRTHYFKTNNDLVTEKYIKLVDEVYI